MAASSPTCAPDGVGDEPASEPEQETDTWAAQGPIVKREPELKLLSPISGVEPLSWSEDHRLAASTSTSISVVELVCDVNVHNQNLILHRTLIPVPESPYEFKVGPEEEVLKVKNDLATSSDPTVTQTFMIDKVMNPQTGAPRGVKYTSWSPLGCDVNGRCLLATLTLDNRLTVYSSRKRLQWTQEVDLTKLYGEMLASRDYSSVSHDGSSSSSSSTSATPAPLTDPEELRRRYRMQTPVRMEWSNMCTRQQVQTNNKCQEIETVLLAVLMENGDLVVWQFSLPLQGEDAVISCNTIQSGMASPSVLAWWEYEHGGRRMSGLIVGSGSGPVKILPVNLRAVKGYFTLRQPVVLWPESDRIPVHQIRCVTLFHPLHKCNCSLVVAARGSYLFWCLLLITKAGLNVHHSHVTGLHATPITSLSAGHHGGSVYTCALDGHVKKLTPIFTDAAVLFKQEDVPLPEGVVGKRLHGISVSPYGAYMAVVTTEGMTNGLHPVERHYQVQFVTLKTPEDAATELLESGVQNLFRQADLLDLLRWKVLRDKCIPSLLMDELDEKVHSAGTPYLWRLKLFLCRVFYQSLQKSPTESRWRPSHEDPKAPMLGEDEGEGDEESQAQGDGEGDREGQNAEHKSKAEEDRMTEVLAWMEVVEVHLTREHMKRVLGEVYLHTWITENTSIPTRGVCDFLASDNSCEDRAAKVLIGHVCKKMNKQTFPEYCSLCKDVLPFNDRRQAVCPNGHLWLRCMLSYQACQSVSYRRCLLQDSIARMPGPEDPEWIKRILQGPCVFCDSPLL
ncbi:general transcription factor 3C polypeptide 4 isoform X1 [Alosa sapidissima]|uniref:general transcription factor 3C polypeptide 4 isoform X1 n=1 Tax=Alosa sapidissima TaxID=34773 RepID=UPI001C09B6C9|nr:general transcription factor 3C polypeptide 4 isoform X1 [Alosa sapidissima]